MRNKIIILLIIIVITMMIIVSLNIYTKYDKKIVLILNSSENEYNHLVSKGAKAASKDLGFELDIFYVQNSDELFDTVEESLADDPKLIIVSDPKFEEDTVKLAEKYYDQNFILVEADADLNLDNVQDVSNIYSIEFARNEIGFLAGIAAAQHAEKNVLFIGTNEFPRYIEYESGFKFGVKTINETIGVTAKYYNEDIDYDNLYDKLSDIVTKNQYDIIYTINDNQAIIDIAFNNDIPVIVSNYDKTSISNKNQQEIYLAGIFISLDHAIYLAINDYANGLYFGQIKYFGAKDSCFQYEVFNHDLTTDDITNKTKRWLNEFNEQLLQIPKTRDDLKSYEVPTLTDKEDSVEEQTQQEE